MRVDHARWQRLVRAAGVKAAGKRAARKLLATWHARQSEETGRLDHQRERRGQRYEAAAEAVDRRCRRSRRRGKLSGERPGGGRLRGQEGSETRARSQGKRAEAEAPAIAGLAVAPAAPLGG